MKLRFVASTRDIIIFVIFAVFLLYVVAIGVLNIPEIAAKGTFYGLNPLEAFSADYIYYTLIIYFIALAGLIMSVNSYFFEFEEGWGLKIGSSTKGGYSDWSRPKDIKTDKDVKKVLASAETVDAAGTPLICNGKELWVDNGEYHTLVIGATGSGKTQDVILPTIKVLAKKGESVIVTDPKGEIYEKAGGLLIKKGYKIILLNFRNPQNGNTWNPLELPYRLYKNGNQDKSIELLDDLALNILYDETNTNSDPFWEKTAADYFSGIALAMFEDTTEDKININSINMTATVGEDKFGGSSYIKEYFNYKDPSSAAYVNASGTVMAPSETKGGIISVFKQKVKLFASRENLSEMLSYSDFKMDDIGREKTAVFIIIQDEKRTYHPLATIFIKQVYETLIDVAQANGGKLPVRTNFLLDEFANMPPLKDVTTMITAARSRQIRFTMIIQNFAQLNKVYGKDDAETIKGNCGNIIYLISTELAALEEISKLCGEKKSKQSEKTSSTPLVSVSDLQRMKQFDHILLRLRKSPFKTSFVPDFKIDWGETNVPKVGYPVREKKPVSIFDIREFVKEKKNQKINEMMASIGGAGDNPFGNMGGASSGGGMAPMPMGGGLPTAGGSKPSIMGNNPMMDSAKKPDLSVNDLVKKIDEKLAEIEKEEEEAKKKNEGTDKPSSTSNKDSKAQEDQDMLIEAELEEIENEKKNKKTDNKSTDKNETKNKNIDLFGDGFTLSNEDIERKVNERLSNNIVKEEVKKKEEKIDDINKRIEDRINKELESFNKKADKKIDEALDSKLEEKVNDKLETKDKKYHYLEDDLDERIDNKIDRKVEEKVNDKLETKNKTYHYLEDNLDDRLDDKIDRKVEEKVNDKLETKNKTYHYLEDDIDERIDSKLDELNKDIEKKVNDKIEKERASYQEFKEEVEETTEKTKEAVKDKLEEQDEKYDELREIIDQVTKNSKSISTEPITVPPTYKTVETIPTFDVVDKNEKDDDTFGINEEEEEVLRLIEEKLQDEEDEQNDKSPKTTPMPQSNKSSSVIKLDDVSDDEKFFDDFFDD